MLGPNGSGKTTLLSVASMNLWPTTGTVDVLGERYGRTDARELRRRVGFAGSAIEAAMRPDLTPTTLIMTARHGAFEPWWHVYDDADRERARELGERMGLGDHLDQAFGTLSAGERRRTSIARALMPDPDVLILDEPMASLDLAARELLLADLEIARPRAATAGGDPGLPPPRGDPARVRARARAGATVARWRPARATSVLRDDVLGEAFGAAADGRAARRPLDRPDAACTADRPSATTRECHRSGAPWPR